MVDPSLVISRVEIMGNKTREEFHRVELEREGTLKSDQVWFARLPI